MDSPRTGYHGPKTPESPRAEKRELQSPRLPSIIRVLFPPTTRLEDMNVTVVQAVWTETLLKQVEEFIRRLPDDKDIATKTARLIRKTGGLTPCLSTMLADKVRELPHDLRSRIFLRTCDLLAEGNAGREVGSLLQAINKAAADLDPQFDAGAQKAMQALLASLGGGDHEAIETFGRALQAIVEKRSGAYGRRDPELNRETGRLGYLGRWAKSALGDCTTDALVDIFDGLVSNIKTARQPIHSRIGTALLDVLCPGIADRVAGSLIEAALEGAANSEVDQFYWFLYLGLSRGSFSENHLRASIDHALAVTGHSADELRRMVEALSGQNATVGRFVGERVETFLAKQ